MATDCRVPKMQIPAIPSSRTVRERLQEVETLAKRLKVLLRVATELEQVDSEDQNHSDRSDQSGGAQ
ncbi:MAG: hypothetical protein ACK6AO_17570 [Planctomycetota bacterium]|jgi:hypothetical protein